MTRKRKAPGAGHSGGDSRNVWDRLSDDSAHILPQDIHCLMEKVPPRGLSYRLLSLWLERHALETQLQLHHEAGVLIDRHPTCPLRVSRRVDQITIRLDRVHQLLSNPLRAAAVLDRGEVA